jgi:hypothetical protein
MRRECQRNEGLSMLGKATFPHRIGRTRSSCLFKVEKPTFQTCVHEGNFVVRFAKRRDLGQKKLVMGFKSNTEST